MCLNPLRPEPSCDAAWLVTFLFALVACNLYMHICMCVCGWLLIEREPCRNK